MKVFLEDQVAALQMVSEDTLQYAAQGVTTALVEWAFNPSGIGSSRIWYALLMVFTSQEAIVLEEAPWPFLAPCGMTRRFFLNCLVASK